MWHLLGRADMCVYTGFGWGDLSRYVCVYRIWVGRPEGKSALGGIGVNERIILK
jgi:hypothetical protein